MEMKLSSLVKCNREKIPQVFFNGIMAGIMVGLVYFLQQSNPALYVYLIGEDLWGEYATFSGYFLTFAFLIGAICLDRKLFKFGYILLAVFALVIAMEEINWGQRLFHITTPDFIKPINSQSEINLHNILSPKNQLTRYFCYGILIWIFIIPAFVTVSRKLKRLAQNWGIPLVPGYLTPYYLTGVIITFYGYPIVKFDEIRELFFGVSFGLLGADILFKTFQNTDLKISKRIAGFFLTIVFVGLTSLLVYITPKDDHAMKWRYLLTAYYDYPERHLYPQAEKLFSYILESKEYRTPEAVFQYGLFLKKINSDKADVILRESLQEQYVLAQQSPQKSEPNIKAGEILELLGQMDNARLEYQKALDKDMLRLSKAKTDLEKAKAFASLGRTYFKMKSYTLALENFQAAQKLEVSKKKGLELKKWIKEAQLKEAGQVKEDGNEK
ncbi:MAG: tetratricopeptide repeat protein [Candidatus Omnitrophica bacterium]|nr:tetratricopeptide repeat protein [Candidatus Omnitrophota bacterium]